MPDSPEVADFEQSGDLPYDPELTTPEDWEAPHFRKPAWIKWLRRMVVASVAVTALLVGGAFLLLHLAKIEPEFYQRALKVDPQLQKKYGSEMESKILDLRNSVIGSDSWSASFSEDQINGWLAWDLQNKFPGFLPSEVTDPRVELGDQSVTVAFRCDAKPFRGIAIVEADVFVTGVINQVGVRIKSIRSGLIPLPLAAFADALTEHARNSNVEIEWLTEEGDPVAIIDLPDELIRPGGDLIEVQKLEISKKQLHLAGATHPGDF